jgi:hypothetical protein
MIAAATYGRIWETIRTELFPPSFELWSKPTQFFSMARLATSDESGRRPEMELLGDFEYRGVEDSFDIRIYEVDEEGAEGATFFDQEYMVKGASSEE